MIWYSKLNANRIGRIDPKTDDGAIKEWNPPFRGPRRLHVAQDGVVWVPGFGSGVFGKFDPKTEKFKNNQHADQMLTRVYREPFVVPSEIV